MNLDTIVTTMNGQEARKSFPTSDEINALPKNEDGTPNTGMLPKETIRNVLLNCVAHYPIEDKREIFYVTALGSLLIDPEVKELKLKQKFEDFLKKVIDAAVVVKANNEQKFSGYYYAWVIAQVKRELGFLEVDEDPRA